MRADHSARGPRPEEANCCDAAVARARHPCDESVVDGARAPLDRAPARRYIRSMHARPPLHLLKLCVGADSIADLEGWIEEMRLYARRAGREYEQRHTTRMVPKRMDEIVGAGSLYWVIKGQVSARQRIEAIRPFTDEGGIGRCHLVLDPVVVPVQPRPCRPFQGWRYLEEKDAPADLSGEAAAGLAEMPEGLRRELADLGLL